MGDGMGGSRSDIQEFEEENQQRSQFARDTTNQTF
jgi:hypothetical protein